MFVDSIGHGQGGAAASASPASGNDQEVHRVEDAIGVPATVEQIANGLSLVVSQDADVEVRVITPARASGKFFSGDNLEELARHALEQDKLFPMGVYFTLNPVNRDRKLPPGKLANDASIRRRLWMLVDADPNRPADISSTNEEKAAALRTIEAVRSHLRSLGWPEPILADSGNGYHLLYRIDLPAEDQGLVNRCLKTLAKDFDNHAVKIDTSVSNASRIVKLYGTVSRKGNNTLERPHRRSRLLEVPDNRVPAPVELLESLAALSGAPAQTNSHSAPVGAVPKPTNASDRARKYLATFEAISGQKGHHAAFQAARVLVRGYDFTPDDAYPILEEWNQTNCKPPFNEGQLRHKLEDADQWTGERGYLLNAQIGRVSTVGMVRARNSEAFSKASKLVSSIDLDDQVEVAGGLAKLIAWDKKSESPIQAEGGVHVLERIWETVVDREGLNRKTRLVARTEIVSGFTPSGKEWRCIVINSKPHQFGLESPWFDTRVLIKPEDWLETKRVSKAIVSQALYPVDKNFQSLWIGSNREATGLAHSLLANRVFEEPAAEDCRDRVVANLIWSGLLGSAAESDGPEKTGRPRRLKDGSLWFKTEYLLTNTGGLKDFPDRAEINEVLRGCGVVDKVRKCDGRSVKFRVLSPSGLRDLEELAHKGAEIE